MRHRLAAPVVAALLAVLAGCGGGSDEPKAKPEPAPTSGQPSEPAVDCDDPNLSQAEWAEHCDGARQHEAPAEETLELGKPAETIGSGGKGALEVTPDTVVYVTEATGETPDNDVFAVVAVKLRPTNAVAAAQAAPIDGGGWSWVGADGQAVHAGDGGAAFNVVPEGFEAGGEIQPGTHEWASVVFDLTEGQAEGGTLMYIDGAGTAYRWAIPAQDAGPQTEKLKQALQ